MPTRAHPLPTVVALLLLGAGCATSRWDDATFTVTPWASTPAGTLTGTVTDAGGNPVSGALVTLLPSGRGVETAIDGTWTIARLLPGSYTVVAAAEGYATGSTAAPTLAADATIVVDSALSAATPTVGVLRVTVLDPAGLPAAGMLVTATWDGGSASAHTGTDGLATVAGLGGEDVRTTIEDPTGRLAGARLGTISVPAEGAAHAALELSGLPATSATPVGSGACATCHPDEAEGHAADPHARALGTLSGTLATDFEVGVEVDLGNLARATLGYDGAQPAVWLRDHDGETRAYTVSGVLGGETRGAVPWTEAGAAAWALPVAYRPGSDLWPDWPATGAGWVANDVSTWFDGEGRFRFADSPAPELSAETQCFGCHATGYSLDEVGDGSVAMASSEGDGRWLEAGVGCERCHGAGSEHVAASDDQAPYTIVNPARLDAEAANDVCAQCHAGLDGGGNTPYAWNADAGSFAAGMRLADFAPLLASSWPAGAADRPSQQANELATSAHGGGDWTARCTDCHGGHQAGGERPAGVPLDARDNTLCAACHLALSFDDDEQAMAGHGGHPAYVPGSDTAAGRCTGCHMPTTATRTGWNDASGGGDLQSHALLPVAPAFSLADFDALGAAALPAGSFTPNACGTCHAYNAWLFDGSFPGPTGDLGLRETHAALDAAYQGLFP